MTPVVIATPAGPCFAAYHPAPGPAVLVCPPFGAEAGQTARAWRALAGLLAARGIATLRPDLPGTGQSGGDAAAPGLLADWQVALQAMGEWLAARHGGRLVLLGHRMGALLALDALGGTLRPESLVLLDPPASGAALSRALRARARLEGWPPHPADPDLLQAWDAPLRPETLAGLARLPRAPAAPLPPVLLVAPLGDAEPPLATSLAAQNASVSLLTFEGYAAFAGRDALDAVVPLPLLERIADHLAAAAGPAGAVAAPPPPLARLELPGLAETPHAFGPALFGVLCRPALPAAGRPAVLLPSVGAHGSAGKARMWTELARRLACSGIASLRFDMHGVGESGGDTAPDRLAAAYHPDRVAELRAALDLLAAEGCGRVAAIAHCSGAYTALMAAADGAPPLAGLLAANPVFLNRQTVLAGPVLWRRPGTAPTLAAPAPAPQASPPPSPAPPRRRRPGLVGLLRRACPRPLWHLLRGLGAEERQGRARLRRLARRGCALQLVFGDREPGLARLQRALGEPPRLPRDIRLHVLPGADHSFSAWHHRAALLDLAAGFATGLLAPGAPPPPTPRAPLETTA